LISWTGRSFTRAIACNSASDGMAAAINFSPEGAADCIHISIPPAALPMAQTTTKILSMAVS
jgi:hypothetical protein